MRSDVVLDQEHFRQMTCDDPELQAEVLALFRAQAGLWTKLLSPDAPVQTWRDAAHSIKGSARGIGFWTLARACETAEELAKSGVKDGPLVTQELRRVRAALAEAVSACAELHGEALAS